MQDASSNNYAVWQHYAAIENIIAPVVGLGKECTPNHKDLLAPFTPKGVGNSALILMGIAYWEQI